VSVGFFQLDKRYVRAARLMFLIKKKAPKEGKRKAFMDLYRIYVISLMLLKGNSIDKKSSQHKSNSFAKHKKNNKFIEIQKNLHLLIS